ncbi:MAG: hypothetical protein IPP41_07885 [Rhodocyclaceae bacterium]|nr:hypothetical protein [Rhodocyclaceae bacterium]
MLADDPNVEHLHQFSAGSLCALLQRAGFTVQRLTSGHFESLVYGDSLRILARPSQSPESKRASLIARFKLALHRPFAVWGIGGDYLSYVAPWIASLPLKALIDSNPARHGERIGEFSIQTYDKDRHKDLLILVASLRFATEITLDAKACGVAAGSLVYLDDIYGEPFSKHRATEKS